MNLICSVFDNPNDPMYYVVGVIFLALVFGALAVYIILDRRKHKKSDGSESANPVNAAEPAEQPESKEESEPAEQHEAEEATEPAEQPETKEATEPAEQPETEDSAKKD